MANRYYLSEGLSQKEQNKLRQRFVCAECGEWVNFWLEKVGGRTYLACHRHNINGHEGVAKEFIPPSEQNNLARRESMSEKSVIQDRALANRRVPLSGIITKEQATIILRTVWPGAPDIEVYKAALLCQDYGLHPLMKHVYLIKYDRYIKQPDGSRKKEGEDWTTVLGIGATRLIMARQGTFSYIDDTPRIMSDEEQKHIFGKVDPANVVAITKLRTRSGLEASGYGKYPRDGKPKGTDKGNSIENMAFIRSERNASGRLFPDAKLPGEVDVVDEQYMEIPSGGVNMETGEIIEESKAVAKGEVITTIEESEVLTPLPEPPKTTAEPTPVAVTEGTEDLSALEFKNAGELKAACKKYFGLMPSTVDKEIHGYDLSDPANRKDAWLQILGAYQKE